LGLIVLIAGIYFFSELRARTHTGLAWDFAINWTATKGLENGISLYDRARLGELGRTLIGVEMSGTFTTTFNSYIGLPTTAIFLIPFTLWPFTLSLVFFRLSSLVSFLLAIFFAGLSLSDDSRWFVWTLGLIAFLMSDAALTSLQAGQLDGWITLALAISIWLASKEHWGLAGIGLGIATLLKISPVFLVIYCLLRGKTSAAISACLTIGVGLGLGMLMGKPGDTWRFVVEISPMLSAASLQIQNQSLVAWLARIVLPENNLLDFSIGIGIFRWLVLPLAAFLLLLLWSCRRNKVLKPLELGLVIILALLIGPITWDHYTAWAILSIAYAAQYAPWGNWPKRQRIELFAIFVLGLVLLSVPTLYFLPATIANESALRLATGTKTFGLLIILGVEASLLLPFADRPGLAAESPAGAVQETG
jgi:Glycosyltransferase family 87